MPPPRTTFLVTGFPSWIARAVVREIVHEEDGALVHLLVTRDRAGDAETFVRDLRPLDSSVSIVEGDAVGMDLGLAGRSFVALARELDVVVNLYDVSALAESDGTHGYGGLYGKLGRPTDLTVRAVREAMEIACAAPHLRHLVHLGSLTVAGEHRVAWTEEDVSTGQTFGDEAGRSRHAAERLLWRRRAALPFTSVRVGIVLGDSRTGEIDWYHGPHDLLDLIVHVVRSTPLHATLRSPPPLHPVPSDHLARLIRAIASSPPDHSGAVNVAGPAPVTLAALQAAVDAARARIGGSPAGLERAARVLRQRLRRRYGSSPAAMARTVARLDTPATLSTRRAQEIERAAGLNFPALAEYLPNLVAHLLARAEAEVERRAEAVEDALDS